MDELQIHNILSRLSWTKDTFRGVYSSNTLPRKKIKDRPCTLVVNTDEEHEPGSHWTAIYLDSNGVGEYFDSYGLPPLSKHVVNFMNTNTKHWTFNKRQLQNVITTMCGPYVIFFLMYKGQYTKTMAETIKNMFPDDQSLPLMNDAKVQCSLYHRFGLYVPLVEIDIVRQQMLRLYNQ